MVRNPTIFKIKDEILGRIEFKNIKFRYKDDDSKLVLNNVSFVIEAGMKVGFVGPSGCGKSTILQLLLRFYEF
jgi:ABC-type multidrug transport system fused ATPase/permease subunit